MTAYNILGVIMFDNLFENRNRTVSELIKLGDYLGRSLRENVSIFKIDVEDKSVCYVTESNKVIAGNYEFGDQLKLNNIVVEDIESFSSDDKFDILVDSKISGFVKNIYEDSHKKAKSSFDDLLYLWESRLKFKNIKTKLTEKANRFNQTSKIVESNEFQKFLEIAPQLVDYLKENKSKISKISEIRSAVRLSQTISEAFDLAKTDYDILAEEGVFAVAPTVDSSIYDVICRHELVKKELLEHKSNFDTVWASNEKIQNLAGLLYSDEQIIEKALLSAAEEVPYLCLASKKQLTETFKNALNLNKVKDISISDVQKFASLVFEMKKPLKAELINHLNERYGVNVQNLKDPVTFKSLLNTQVVIFETLAKISPKKSVQREVLLSLSESLNEKNGVEAIDCNEVIQEVFMAAGYDDILINESLNNYLDFEKIASDLDKVGGVLRMIKGASAGAPQPTPSMGMEVPPPQSVEDDDVKVPAMTPEDDEEGAMAMAGAESMSSEEENDEIEAGEAEPSQEEVMGKMKELEDLISSLKMEIGGGEESDDEMEDFEESPEEESAEGEEEEIDMEQADLDDQEDEIEAEHEEAHETEDEAEEKEDIVRKKKKSLEKKEDNLKKMK